MKPKHPLYEMIRRNPGVTAVWHVSRQHLRPNADGLFDIGHPYRVDWWTEGRAATRAEVLAGVETGLPELRKLCDTPADHAALDRAVKLAAEFFPAA